MNIISGIYWDKGLRACNQDSLMLEQVYTRRGRLLLAVVSDGIGGLSEGETASGFVVEKFRQYFYQEITKCCMKGRKRLIRACLRCIYESCESLTRYRKEKDISLGATVSLLLIYCKSYFIMHLGDCRIYQINSVMGKGNLQRLTRDHKDEKGRLIKCVGSYAYRQPDIKKGRIRRNTGFLLCSDGFYRLQEIEKIEQALQAEEIVESRQIEKRLNRLAQTVMEQGEQDNISAIYVLCKGKGEK